MTRMENKETGEVPNDDSVVLRVHLVWTSDVSEALGQPNRGCVHRRDDGLWELVCSIQRGSATVTVPGPRGVLQRHFIAVGFLGNDEVRRGDRWPLIKLGDKVWDIPVSVHIPGQLHAFITLLGVPEPPPWR